MDVAFILLRTGVMPSAEAVAREALRYGFKLIPAGDGDGKPLSFTIEGGGPFLAMLIDAPHPDAARTPAGPTAADAEDIKDCKAHVIVTAMSLKGTVRQRDAQMAGLAAAIAAASDAVGVQLAHGILFHKAQLYCEMAALALESGELPAEFAVDITVASEPGERMSFLTHGMPRYGREEFFITCPVQGKGALGFIFDMTRWMLTDKQKQLPTGDTVGRSAEEKVVVQRVPNPTGRGGEVIRLDLP